MAGASFQQQVNIQYAAGVPGALYDDSPERSATWELNSAEASYNVIGATAFTASSADPGSGDACGVAAAGGTGQFVGILSNSKLYANVGTTTGSLNPSSVVANNVPAQLTSMGHLWVTLPGAANVGDQVGYDATTGQLATFPKLTSFTATLTESTGLLNVSAISAGFIQPGMIISGAGFAGVTITEYDSGVGGTGTYYTNATGNISGNISSEVMTGYTLPPPAFSATASAITTAGAMTISAVGSGELAVGDPIYGTGIPAEAVILTAPEGGGTGAYTIAPPPLTTLGSTTVTGDQLVAIPHAEVILFAPAGDGGLGVISLTSA